MKLFLGPPVAEHRSLFFMHIPKTAGMALRHAIVNQFPAGASLCDVHWASRRTESPNRYQFVTGHVPYPYIRRFAQRPLVVTFLRDPVQRAISHFYFYRSLDERELVLPHICAPEKVAETLDVIRKVRLHGLHTFLKKEPDLAHEVLGNLQSRYFVAKDVDDKCQWLWGLSSLPAAVVRNLQKCDVVGLNERMEESLAVLCSRAGLAPMVRLPRENATASRPALQDIRGKTIAALRDLTRLDAELQRLGEELLEGQLREVRAAPPAADTDEQPWLPDGGDFTLDQPLFGRGWHPRDYSDGLWMSWSAEREAWLDVALHTRGDHWLCCAVHHFLPEALDGLELRVNGRAVPCLRGQWWDDATRWEFAAKVPADVVAMHPGWARIAFVVRELVRPSEVDAANLDHRLLGVAVSHVRLVPADVRAVPAPALKIYRAA